MQDDEKKGDPVKYVEALLSLRDKYQAIIEEAFEGDKSFLNALNGAFESFVNDNAQSPEFISLFVDDQLRRGLKGHSEDDMERLLDKVVMLFRYLQDKDIFEKYYKQHLAKRLLGARSVSDDAERSMITKLKHECGYQFTSKLEGMFLDMKMSADTQDAFREKVLQPSGSSKIDGVELGVHVLTTGFWPTQLGPRCNLPPQIARCCEAFKDFYLKQHSGRKLTWQTNMGNADIKASFRARRRTRCASSSSSTAATRCPTPRSPQTPRSPPPSSNARSRVSRAPSTRSSTRSRRGATSTTATRSTTMPTSRRSSCGSRWGRCRRRRRRRSRRRRRARRSTRTASRRLR